MGRTANFYDVNGAILIYISLPVHTQPAAIVSQLKNFACFFPEATVVMHISAEARFSLADLRSALAAGGCANAIVNPHRSPTAWGDIVPAHLANIALIRRLGRASHICLHSSNDMLVRSGLAPHLTARGNLFNRRVILPGSYWRFGAAALADGALQTLCRWLGGAAVVGSQLEGSCYEAALLFEIADRFGALPAWRPPMPYPREEVWFSTAAHGLVAGAGGTPYVFSEIHRFDRMFWRVLRHINPLIGTRSKASHSIRRVIEFLMIKSGFHCISEAWVDAVAACANEQLAPYETLSDGNSEWRVFDCRGLFGVKRVPRPPGSPLRNYIDALAVPGAIAPIQAHTETPCEPTISAWSSRAPSSPT
jgi:hypothetical protein